MIGRVVIPLLLTAFVLVAGDEAQTPKAHQRERLKIFVSNSGPFGTAVRKHFVQMNRKPRGRKVCICFVDNKRDAGAVLESVDGEKLLDVPDAPPSTRRLVTTLKLKSGWILWEDHADISAAVILDELNKAVCQAQGTNW